MTNDEIYYNSFPLLLHKITCNLRYLFLEIDNKRITLTGYYATDPDATELELLEDISDGVAGMVETQVPVTATHVVSTQEYIAGMHSGYLLYAKYENF